MPEIVNRNEVEKQIAASKSKISYLKSKRTKVCARCGKEFVPAKSMKERYCSDACRKLAIQETKHKAYLKNRANPEYVQKNKEYSKAWRIKKGLAKPKPQTVSIEEYNSLKKIYYISEESYNNLMKAYNDLNDRFDEIIKNNQRLVLENHQLRSKTFIQKLKDLL